MQKVNAKEKTEIFAEFPANEGLKTELAIELAKNAFSDNLSNALSLYKVTAPIAVEENSGINDDLNGTEKAVTFTLNDIDNEKGVIVHSLAKWKRMRLKELGIEAGKGIITNMKAIRPDEELSSIHSVLVDQWDWEKVINNEDRNINFLKDTVKKIYDSMLKTEKLLFEVYPEFVPVLPSEIKFIHTQELLDLYPELPPKERENMIARELGAVFLIGIGCDLSNGLPHDGRAPDYDDWSTATSNAHKGLNGDIIVWNSITNSAFEISSMGIRVNRTALLRQLKIKKCMERQKLNFHKALLYDALPLCIGGGIGQSRLCMFLLKKKHIGEVQVGIWPAKTKKYCKKHGIHLIGNF